MYIMATTSESVFLVHSQTKTASFRVHHVSPANHSQYGQALVTLLPLKLSSMAVTQHWLSGGGALAQTPLLPAAYLPSLRLSIQLHLWIQTMRQPACNRLRVFLIL